MAKKNLTVKLVERMSEDYRYLQTALVDIFEVMVREMLENGEEGYNLRLEKFKNFLDNEIYFVELKTDKKGE